MSHVQPGVSTQAMSRRNARLVWAYLTKNPTATFRTIMNDLNLPSTHTVYSAVRRLRKLGYIRRRNGQARAVTVVVPFGFID